MQHISPKRQTLRPAIALTLLHALHAGLALFVRVGLLVHACLLFMQLSIGALLYTIGKDIGTETLRGSSFQPSQVLDLVL